MDVDVRAHAASAEAPQGAEALVDDRDKGVAPIKADFLYRTVKAPDEARAVTEPTKDAPRRQRWSGYSPTGSAYGALAAAESRKRVATEEADSDHKHKRTKGEKKQQRGQNKKRRKVRLGDGVCSNLLRGEVCTYGDKCKWSHDIEKYLAEKPPDLPGVCPFTAKFGWCRYALGCRFGRSHTADNKPVSVGGGAAAAAAAMYSPTKSIYGPAALHGLGPSESGHVAPPHASNIGGSDESGWLSVETRNLLRKNKRKFPKTDAHFAMRKAAIESRAAESKEDGAASRASALDQAKGLATVVRSERSKKVDFRDKLLLAPLTTVGNLPFRRVVKGFGVDVTYSEMTLALNLLRGQPSEWSMVRRHACEDIFGVQIAGNRPDVLARTVEVLQDEANIDFIDLNCGCPIDGLCKTGSGAALMRLPSTKFEKIVRAMSGVATVPLSIKLRTGYTNSSPSAHMWIPKLKIWGADLITIHGRSKEARYTRLANWDYIDRCASIADPVPLVGNGDVLSWQDVVEHKEKTKVSSVMIGRGALIKPWIFTEIKERRDWDISSSERFDMLKDFARFGLEHWGSDTEGVEKTRRFMLEWCSFLCRYIPIGLLERLPQRINERPPPFFGRNDLETLMASPAASDWIKLTEMLLGPAHKDLDFVPKHKSNAYVSTVAENEQAHSADWG